MDTIERPEPLVLPALEEPPSASTSTPAPKPASASQKVRRLFITVHLWIGLTAGAWFALVGLTGSLLAFRSELLNAELTRRYPVTAAGAEIIPLSKAVEALQAAYPLLTERELAQVTVPSRTSPYYSVTRGARRGDRLTFLVDPYTAKVHRPYNPRTTFISTVNQLHTRLLLGFRGYVANGALTVIGAFLLLTGLYIWWPPAAKLLKDRLLVKRGASLNRTLYDLHNVLGIYLFPLLLLLAVTGALIVGEHLVRDGAEGFWRSWNGTEAAAPGGPGGRAGGEGGARGGGRRGGPEEEVPRMAGRTGGREGGRGPGAPGGGEGPSVKVAVKGRRLSDDEVAAAARTALPGHDLTRIRRPAAPDEAYQLTYSTPVGISRTRTELFDPYAGRLIPAPAGTEGGRAQSPFSLWTRQLHFGEYGGVASKVVYAITGVLPLGLFITGVTLWLRKKIKRSRRNGT